MRDSTAEIYAVADEIRVHCFGELDSLLSSNERVWSVEPVGELLSHFVDTPDLGSGKFLAKLAGQLRDVSPGAVELMAHLAVIYQLAPVNVGVPKKREMVEGVLAIGKLNLPIPDRVLEAFTGGIANPGTWYMTRPDVQLSFLVRFVAALTAMSEERRHEVVSDPWAFRDALYLVPLNSGYGQRAALMHLMFPDTFESIVASHDKKRILDFYEDKLAERTGDEDRDMLALRAKLADETPERVSLYRPPWNGWRTKKETIPGWLVRGAKVQGTDLVPQWLAEGFCSIAFEEIPEIPDGTSAAKINEIIAQAQPDLSLPERRSRAGNLDRFLNRIKPGHVVVTLRGNDVYVGRATGLAQWTESPDGVSSRRRPVKWLNPTNPLQRSELTQGAQGKLSGQNTVSDLGLFADEMLGLVAAETSEPDDELIDPTDAAVSDTDLELPDPTQALAKELFVPLSWLTEVVELLGERKQIVLYGPPGTGKTYLAQAIAQFLVNSSGGEIRLVQFHPSYAYEDFFEGFRPRPGDLQGSIVFDLVPGPLRRIAALAEADPTSPYVLVIDEMNRANLAKVFGEMYFLLEYRRRTVSLQYSPDEDFSLPANLLIIATMNTADRSIALIDQAMRRRFDFVSLFPGEEPVDGMLREWLRDNAMAPTAADAIDALNRVLNDRDSAIGPSYFMSERARTTAGLERIWKTAIIPLLEERFAGDAVDVASRYSLSRFLSPTDTLTTLIAPEASDQPSPIEHGSAVTTDEPFAEPLDPTLDAM